MAKEKIDINTVEGRKKFLKGKKILFQCCFCASGIDIEKNDYVTITIDKTEQFFWCHASCLFPKMNKFCFNQIQKGGK